MVHPLPDKIERELAHRGLLKRDLAKALGVSPQTATDICKGRSAVTLPHLRRLVEWLGLRADYWLDDARGTPDAADRVCAETDVKVRALHEADAFAAESPAALLTQLREFARERADEFVARFPNASDDVRRQLGLPARSMGQVGAVAAERSAEVSA